jgi:hypothetical protein
MHRRPLESVADYFGGDGFGVGDGLGALCRALLLGRCRTVSTFTHLWEKSAGRMYRRPLITSRSKLRFTFRAVNMRTFIGRTISFVRVCAT